MPRPCGCSSAPHESTRRCCGHRIRKVLARRGSYRDLFPLSGYGSDDMDLFERVLAIREKNARSRRSPHGRKPEQSRRGAVQRGGLSDERDRCSSEPWSRRRDSWARTIQRWPPPRPISPTCCRGPATTTAARPLYERALSIWEKSLGADHPKVATALVNLARFYLRTGSYHDARAAAGPGAGDSGEGAGSRAPGRRAAR